MVTEIALRGPMSKKKADPVEDPFQQLGWKVGEIVRRHRVRAGFTLRELSAIVGMPASTIHWTEFGDRERAVTVERLCRLGSGLGKEFLQEIVQLILEFPTQKRKGARS